MTQPVLLHEINSDITISTLRSVKRSSELYAHSANAAFNF